MPNKNRTKRSPVSPSREMSYLSCGIPVNHRRNMVHVTDSVRRHQAIFPQGAILEGFTLVLVAIGLAMDAFAVSVAVGFTLGCVTGGQTMRMAAHFGFFQFLMPVMGWFAGIAVVDFIHAFDHWIAMGLLGFIGGKMIYEACHDLDSTTFSGDPTRGATLIMLSVAISIDALAVGLSLGVLNSHILYPSIIIGLVAGGFTVLGIRLGCRLGMRFSRRVEIFGGLILIAIGIKIVLEHMLPR